jgi:hypothetical protein
MAVIIHCHRIFEISSIIIGFILKYFYGKETLFNLGTGIGSSILASLLFFVIIEQKIQSLFGTIAVPKLDFNLFIKELLTGDKNTYFYILDTWSELANNQEYIHKLEIALFKNRNLQILLANPYSNVIEQRTKDLNSDAKKLAQEGAKNLFWLLYGDKSEEKKNRNQKIKVKFVDSTISIILYAWQDRAQISFLPPDSMADTKPVLETSLTSSFGRFAKEYFNALWEKSSNISLYDHMKVRIDLNNDGGWISLFYCICSEKKLIYISTPDTDDRQSFDNHLETKSSTPKQIQLSIDQIFTTGLSNIGSNSGSTNIYRFLNKIPDTAKDWRKTVVKLFETRYGPNNEYGCYLGKDPTFFYVTLFEQDNNPNVYQNITPEQLVDDEMTRRKDKQK